MIIGICIIDLHIPDANSLKDKRSSIKSLLHKIRRTFNVSVCELESQDLWRKATLGMTCISSNQKIVSQVFNGVEKLIEANGNIQVMDVQIEIL